VNGPRTVQVRKRDGSVEDFNTHKLAAAIWRAMAGSCGRYGDACDLATAIRIYLDRTGRVEISSAALFEMVVKVLRRVRMNHAAGLLEAHRSRRAEARDRITVLDGRGRRLPWDKTALAAAVQQSWNLSRTTARILAGRLESRFLLGRRRTVRRTTLIARLNALVAEFGLADAVPVRPPVVR